MMEMLSVEPFLTDFSHRLELKYIGIGNTVRYRYFTNDTLYWGKNKLYTFLISGSISNDIRLKNCIQIFKTQTTQQKMCVADPIFPIPDPGSRFDKIPDQNLVFLTQKLLQSYQKLDLGCSSLIPEPGSGFCSITDPGTGSHIQGLKGTRSRIRKCNTAKNLVQIRVGKAF